MNTIRFLAINFTYVGIFNEIFPSKMAAITHEASELEVMMTEINLITFSKITFKARFSKFRSSKIYFIHS